MQKNFVLSALGAFVLGSVQMATPAQAQMAMPSDADATCLADISGWFEGSQVALDGAVTAPSSVTFTDDNPNGGEGPQVCNFYQWGAQAFMWLTSPDGDGRVLDGAGMFNVLTPVTKGGVTTRKLQDAGTAKALNVTLRSEKGDDEIGEIGQAGGGGVLMSQAESLVYYGVHVNDGYADFLTGQKRKALSQVDFPHNATDLAAIQAYVENVGLEAPQDPETLAIELKTSWVDAATVGDPSAFVTIPAIVPVYTPNADNSTWTVSDQTKAITLAMVGMHIVGTVQDHPEFVWATFEHVSNAPDATYWYSNASQDTVQFPYDSSGDFLFLETGAAASGANVECMAASDRSIGSIVAETDGNSVVCEGGIVPSNTVRTRPWGSSPYGPPDVGVTDPLTGDVVTQEVVDGIVKNNTLLLSLNSDILAQITAGDPRKNYVQTGGIWTTTPEGGGDAPIPNQGADQTAQMRGSLGLYNATMETYSQASLPNCFTCHQLSATDTNSFVPFGLSHVYSEILPLE